MMTIPNEKEMETMKKMEYQMWRTCEINYITRFVVGFMILSGLFGAGGIIAFPAWHGAAGMALSGIILFLAFFMFDGREKIYRKNRAERWDIREEIK